jgi:phage shock protein A
LGTGGEAVEAARRQREALRKAMIELETAVASASRAPSWIEGLENRLERLQTALNDHISEVESTEGLITQVLENAPRLSNHVEILHADHRRLVLQARQALELLHSFGGEPDTDGVAALRDAVLELLGQLSRHRQRGVDLVYDAYDVDIGGQA